MKKISAFLLVLLSLIASRYSISDEYKNKLINPTFELWERGTSFTSVPNSTYTTDRWAFSKAVTGGQVDITRETDTPNPTSNYSAKIKVTTVDTSVGATEYAHFRQRIEGYNFRSIAEREFTLSFDVKSSKTGTYCVSFANWDGGKSYVSEYTISSANTWEHESVTVAASPSAGNWQYTTDIGLHVRFAIMAGSDYQSTAGSWQSGNFLATSNQVNLMNTVNDYIEFDNVQLEKGDTETDFEQRSIGEELNLAQRYFEKNTPFYVDAVNGAQYQCAYQGQATGSSNLQAVIHFKTQKRVAPTMRYYAPNIIGSPTAGRWCYFTAASGWVESTNTNDGDAAVGGVGVQVGGTGFTFGQALIVHGIWTADAEL